MQQIADLPEKTGSQAADGGWALQGPDQVQFACSALQSDTYQFRVQARTDPGSGASPSIQISVDGQPQAATPVTSTSYADYTLTVPVTYGHHRIAISDIDPGSGRRLYLRQASQRAMPTRPT
jgi:hypothetical protein